MRKTIVLFSDGTGQGATGVPSNARRLYELLPDDSQDQVAMYDPGVGASAPGERLAGRWRRLSALAFGTGVAGNLLEMYTWLARHYDPGDRVFLFGFSRGAFTARALAGLVHVCGLVRREHVDLAETAVRLYERSEHRIVAELRRLGRDRFSGHETDHGALDGDARSFKAQHGVPCPIAFLGLWDTVKAYGWIRPRSFPALRHNPAVRQVRHAVALDERRALFAMTGWGDRHPGVKEAWFAGDHADVGGGHTSGPSPLTDAALRWMIGEATQHGLRLDRRHEETVAALTARAAQAADTHTTDLWLRQGFALLDALPRTELDNSRYPPLRRWRVLAINGARSPGSHRFGSTVVVHHTLHTRLRRGDPRYHHGRLTRGAPPGAPVDVEPAADAPILWRTAADEVS